jgi:hypothetical protein
MLLIGWKVSTRTGNILETKLAPDGTALTLFELHVEVISSGRDG